MDDTVEALACYLEEWLGPRGAGVYRSGGTICYHGRKVSDFKLVLGLFGSCVELRFSGLGCSRYASDYDSVVLVELGDPDFLDEVRWAVCRYMRNHC